MPTIPAEGTSTPPGIMFATKVYTLTEIADPKDIAICLNVDETAFP